MWINIKKIIKKFNFVPIVTEKPNLKFLLNLVFFMSLPYNFIVMLSTSYSVYFGFSWVLAFFSSISALLLVYGSPFFFTINVNHILGKLYLLSLTGLSITTTLFLFDGSKWHFLVFLVIINFLFIFICETSPYIQSLTTLKSMPLKLKALALFKQSGSLILTSGGLGLAYGLALGSPLEVKILILYSLLNVIFSLLYLSIKKKIKIPKKKKRFLPTGVTKLLIINKNNQGYFYDLRLAYISLFTVINVYKVFLILFLGTSFLFDTMHIFAYYVVTVFMITTLVSFPVSQEWIKSTYGPKSLRLLGWNSPWKWVENSGILIVKLFTATSAAIGVSNEVGSEYKYQTAKSSNKASLNDALETHAENSRKYGHNPFVQQLLDKTLEHENVAFKAPLREECRVNIVKDLTDSLKPFVEVYTKTALKGGDTTKAYEDIISAKKEWEKNNKK